MCFRIKCTSNLSIDLKAHPDLKSFQCDFLFPIYPSYKLILPSIDLSFVYVVVYNGTTLFIKYLAFEICIMISSSKPHKWSHELFLV